MKCPNCGNDVEVKPFCNATCLCGAEWVADEDAGGNPTGEWVSDVQEAARTVIQAATSEDMGTVTVSSYVWRCAVMCAEATQSIEEDFGRED